MVTIFSIFILANLLIGLDCRSMISSSSNDPVSKASKTLDELKRKFLQDPAVSKDVEYFGNLTNVDEKIVDTRFLNEEMMRRFIATQGLDLEKILANFAARTTDFKDYEERASQWLRLLKQMLQAASSGPGIEKSGQTDTQFNDIGEIETILIEGDKKIIPISGNWLGDLLEFLDERDIDGQSSDNNERHVKSRYENSSQLFSLPDENTEEKKDDHEKFGQYSFQELDRMLVGVQNEIEQIRKYFEKLCSKHHSMSSTRWHGDHQHDQSSNIIDGKKL